jgi:glutathione S-transferase
MSTLADLEAPIAVCYLHRADDERNRCWLTERYLIVQKKGKKHVFKREILRSLAIEQRRDWLPLIAGGIAAPLSLLALLLNLYSPWVLVCVFLPALLLLYLGWQPYAVLAVHDAVKPHDFRLPSASPNLRAFLRFANRMIVRGDESIYHVARAEDWALAEKAGHYAPSSLADEGFIHASHADQLEKLRYSDLFTTDINWVVLTIDPLKVLPEVRYELDVAPTGVTTPTDELFPHIYGPLNIDAVDEVNPL